MYDLVVIGGGSAGITFAKFAPQFGAKVAVIEANRFGGDCTWTGCVPSKALIHAAKIAHMAREGAALGIGDGNVDIDFAAVTRHVRTIQDAIYAHDDAPEVLRKAGATPIIGRARFRNAEELEVNGETIRAKAFCIATGSGPAIPPIDGLSEVGYLTNEDVFGLDTLPPRLLVIGGGPIGCELGQAFARFGSKVTIVQADERLLSKDDATMSTLLREALEAEGLTVHTGCKVSAVRRTVASGKEATLSFADGSTATVTVDEILVAAGRKPHLKGLGLDVAGVAYDERKGISVDDYLRTTNPRIYACGDVIGRYQFTHMAGAEAGVVIRNVLFPFASKMNYANVPWVTFTDPEVAHVGLNEDAARAKYGKRLNVYELPWSANDRARTESDTRGCAKLLTVGLGNTLVGAHIIGAGAGDLIHELVVAIGAGLGLGAVSGPIHAYPTRALGVRNAAQQSLTRWLGNPALKGALRTYFRLFGAR